MKAKTNAVLVILVLLSYFSGLNTANAFYDPGTQRWLNRDPLGDFAFYARIKRGSSWLEKRQMRITSTGPQYIFEKNGVVNWIDHNGMLAIMPATPGLDLASCVGSMSDVWGRAVPGANGWWGDPPDQDDRFEHCRSSCELARGCGRGVSAALGYLKEGIDWLKNGFSNPGGRGDLQAGAHGRDGVNCPQKSCDDYCRDTRAQYPPAEGSR